MTKLGTTLLAVLAAASVAACDSPTSGDGGGEPRMQVAAVGDDQPAQQSASGGAPSYQQTTAEGTVTFRARVYAQTSAGGWVELTNGAAQQATVDAAGRAQAVVLATSNVEAGAYGRVRMEFEQVRASVNGTIQVETGLLSGQVTVDGQGDGRIVVERQVSASARAGATTRLLVNLNAGAWLNHASATTRTVSEAAFQSAVTVTAS